MSTVEEVLAAAGIAVGPGEKAFAAAEDNTSNPQKDHAVLLDKGVRLMARKSGSQWQIHLLTGAHLQSISKS